MGRALRFLLLGLAVAAAAVAVNLVLVGYVGDRNDPVGKLRPVAPGLAPPATTAPVVTLPAPAPPRHGERDD